MRQKLWQCRCVLSQTPVGIASSCSYRSAGSSPRQRPARSTSSSPRRRSKSRSAPRRRPARSTSSSPRRRSRDRFATRRHPVRSNCSSPRRRIKSRSAPRQRPARSTSSSPRRRSRGRQPRSRDRQRRFSRPLVGLVRHSRSPARGSLDKAVRGSPEYEPFSLGLGPGEQPHGASHQPFMPHLKSSLHHASWHGLGQEVQHCLLPPIATLQVF